MIEVRDLSKWFSGPGGQRVTAVDAVRFTVNPGEVFGLLGPNGAGKTTTLRMLCTVLTPSDGTATVAGHDVVTHPGEVRRHVGFLSANTGVYDRMTAWEFVEYYGRLHQVPPGELGPRMEELFELLQMTEFRNVRGGKLSTGMKQKLSIARAMVNDPPVLIFDEPTAGLDVLVQRAVLDNIKRLRARGKTIIFSTHIMREVEKLCDRVAVMSKGKLVVCGTLHELREMYKQNDLEELFFSLVS
ncbi:MAG TPA: ATP-binding cassette domain-containing protein [Gemmata sp.]